MKQIITGGEWAELERHGKLEPREVGKIKCYFCTETITTIATDARGKELPRCRPCNIYYQPHWTLQQDGTLAIGIMPRIHDYEHTETNEIPQATQNETETSNTDEKAPQHKDVRGQILRLFDEKDRPIQTAEFLNLISASRQSITNALKKLIAEGRVHQTQRGTYELLKNQDNVS